ncbi:MAG: LysR family transcriptional regulator [Mesorhizobium sp.]|uniref:LysR family transcriptional regulator n=1 Tax=Mesorhizobium sp. TaxID=1871066 RepID=UPI000FE57433|nr:MAG: LysR family transcriptional regulator [Mesorhizobium sp.]
MPKIFVHRHTTLPPINTLKVFLAVMQCGTLRNAARKLEITPQAVGHHMKLLERFLQVDLFKRKANVMTPTEKAILLLHFVRSGFSELERGIALVVSRGGGSSAVGHKRLGDPW